MYAFFNKYKKVIAGVILIVFIAIFSYMLGIREATVQDNRNTADTAREQLNTVAEEQRRTTESLSDIQNRIDDSIGTIDELKQSNRDAQDTASGIGDTNNELGDAITNAKNANERSTELLRDSEQRISESLGIVQDIRRTGE